MMPGHLLARVCAASFLSHAFCIVSMIFLLPLLAPTYQPSSFVWATFIPDSESPMPTGISNNGCVCYLLQS